MQSCPICKNFFYAEIRTPNFYLKLLNSFKILNNNHQKHLFKRNKIKFQKLYHRFCSRFISAP
jgi:hypothetical protein